jgi:hypothetical protein
MSMLPVIDEYHGQYSQGSAWSVLEVRCAAEAGVRELNVYGVRRLETTAPGFRASRA